MSDCPFCDQIAAGDTTADTDGAAAFPDANPVAGGHTLVVPRRHEPDFFALEPDEQDRRRPAVASASASPPTVSAAGPPVVGAADSAEGLPEGLRRRPCGPLPVERAPPTALASDDA